VIKMSRYRQVLWILSALLLTPLAVFSQGEGKVVYWSPDKTLQAIVIPLHIAEPDFHEHAVEIHSKEGKLLYKKDYSSEDHEHGRCIVHASWSPDSQFFAFSTTSSGGHSSWHCSSYVYSRRLNEIFYLDDFVGGPLVEAMFNFTSLAVFRSKRLNYKDGKQIAEEPIHVEVDLNKIKFEKSKESKKKSD